MYGFNRLNSAKHLRSLFTAGATPSPIRLHRLCPPFAFTHSSCHDIDDFVYVGKGYKICGKGEVEGSISDGHNTYKGKVLPPKLMSKNVVKLTCESTAEGGICNVYLVGTHHVCKKSAREVQTVIQHLKPQVVYLELCSSRLSFLTRQDIKVLTMNEMLDMWKRKEDPFSILYKWFQSKLGNRWGAVAGGECRVAYEESMKYGGKVILGDRPDEITLRRILAKMSAWRYLFHQESVPITKDLLETAKDEKDLQVLAGQEMAKTFPNYMNPLLLERDQYMSAMILKVARKHNSVIAVVGYNHLAGIQKHWKQPVDVKQLLDTGTFTMGKTISTFGAMVVYLSLPGSLIRIIKEILSVIHYYRTLYIQVVKAAHAEREVQGSSPPAPPSSNSDKTKKM